MTRPSKRLSRNRYLPRHLSELGRLLAREVGRGELLSLEETDEILQRLKSIARTPFWEVEIPFSAKAEPRFRGLVRKLASVYSGSVFLWTPLASVCGLLRPVPLASIDFGFDFDLNPEGIMAVFTDDLLDEMLFDYSVDEQNEQVLELEVSGQRWGRARY